MFALLHQCWLITILYHTLRWQDTYLLPPSARSQVPAILSHTFRQRETVVSRLLPPFSSVLHLISDYISDHISLSSLILSLYHISSSKLMADCWRKETMNITVHMKKMSGDYDEYGVMVKAMMELVVVVNSFFYGWFVNVFCNFCYSLVICV